MAYPPTIGGCEKCGGRKYQIAQVSGPPSDPVCSCKGEGLYASILAKNYDHPYWSKEDTEFFNIFFGYDVDADPERLREEPSERKTQCCQERGNMHFQKYQCCPTCHALASEWKKGADIRRRLEKHLRSGRCLDKNQVRE